MKQFSSKEGWTLVGHKPRVATFDRVAQAAVVQCSVSDTVGPTALQYDRSGIDFSTPGHKNHELLPPSDGERRTHRRIRHATKSYISRATTGAYAAAEPPIPYVVRRWR